MINREEQLRKADELAKRTWCDNWPERHMERIRTTGATTVAEFLKRYPALPYHKLGDILGPVAAVQLQKMQFDEANANGTLRHAAMELMVRTLAWDLKRGWRRGGHWSNNRVRAASHFVQDLLTYTNNAELERVGETVWSELERLGPPPDWVPRSIDDPYIRRAFAIGWPDPKNRDSENGSGTK